MSEVKHFTAWLVNARSCLDQDNMDVTVLEDELTGAENPDDPGDWATDGTKDPAFYAVTSVDARDGETDDAIREAEGLLAAAGWTVAGPWAGVDCGYIAVVAAL